MKHLITAAEVKTLARPVSDHTDTARIDTCIEEAERLDIMPTLGGFFLDIVAHKGHKTYAVLLDGGQYEDDCGFKHDIAGLKKTAAYYTYARLIRIADKDLTRYGFVKKTDDYSEAVSEKERVAAYTDARLVADGYFREVIDYLNCKHADFPLYSFRQGIKKYGRAKFKVIGE